MEEMLQAMGGARKLTPEDLTNCVGMMTYLVNSGQVLEEELAEIRKEFEEMYGSDISDLIKKAGEGGADLTEDESEILDMLEQIFGVE